MAERQAEEDARHEARVSIDRNLSVAVYRVYVPEGLTGWKHGHTASTEQGAEDWCAEQGLTPVRS